MSDLPEGWEYAPIGALCNLINGRAFKPQEWSNSGLPIIRIQNLNNPEAKFNFFSGQLESKHHVRDGDLLFAWSGTPGTSFGAHIWNRGDAALNQHIFKIEFPDSDIDRDFLRYAINQKLDELIGSAQGGVGLRHVTKGTFEKTEIAFPPLTEQTRIAAKLEELLTQVDNLKARMDGIPALLNRFRQSVLTTAVSGRLTEEWRSQNPSHPPISTKDLNKAWADTYRLQGKKYKEMDLLPGGLGYTLPPSWVETKVGEVFDVYVGATPSRENTEFWGGPIPWVSSSEVAFCRINNTRESITEAGYHSASTVVHPSGTVMLAMIGQGKTRGQPAILSIEACHNQNTAALRVHPDYCKSEYLYYYLCERYEETRRLGSGNNQQALNKKAVQSLPFPLPPLSEQSEIVCRIEKLFSLVDQLEKKVNEAKTRIDRLTQSILAKAFRGELVPQDPNEEPASLILERIRAQHVAAPKPKRGRKTLK
ncbi:MULTISPECIES: restriction endonuclease subunit S [unclassified Pseudomonas]|uniref:restriction endonuclease subunit S n=1 Tax=unclassified Pseudomonas TaxID=196821 RepID=UPI00067DD158|nr:MULTISPECIES: restriction endonuclease subunit S [unclassified Pseudomonas]RAS24585.1 type I restriction enzyme S subunit [Pseudomonas sp. URMO17WK12:I7]SMF26835.1 type I restriction enzyme, S subunit [Pseudomonas sp. URMO17WK12:I5]